MEIRNNRKVVITGRTVCLVVGILAGICGAYWLVRALVFDDTNLPELLTCITIALVLTTCASRKPTNQS